MTVKGDTLTDKDNAGAALLEACKEATGYDPVPIGTYRGFSMTVTLEDFGKNYYLQLKGNLSYSVKLGSDARGNLVRIENRHACISNALKYAVRMDILSGNPAAKVELPRLNSYTASYYNEKELKKLFELVKGTPLELGVFLASYYGLRRSEIVGLRWDAIDFDRKTISIKHTATEVFDGEKMQLVLKDRTKTKSSHRMLPLVEPFEKLLVDLQAEQKLNRKLCGNCYCTDYLDYIYVNELGELMKPGYLTAKLPELLESNGMRRIRFHDLRHSCASLLLSNGVSLKDIQAWLGHSTISTTANIYVHQEFASKINSANAILQILPMDKKESEQA